MTATGFWQTKTLTEMSREEWESVCDGCGKCCLHKLEDEDSGEVYYTDVACKYLSEQSCRCEEYPNRLQLVPSCIRIDPQNLSDFTYLPVTCAYRRLAAGEDLYDWHHLVSGSRETIHRAGMSVRQRVIPESDVDDDAWEERIIHWVV